MNDKGFEKIIMNLFWELMLLASGIRLTENWGTVFTIIGYAFIAMAITNIVGTIVVPILKTRS